MKIGDLVKLKRIVPRDPEVEKYGMFLGIKTFDGNYTCSEVMWYPENKIQSIQSDLLEVV